jgi:hypothetical protein
MPAHHYAIRGKNDHSPKNDLGRPRVRRKQSCAAAVEAVVKRRRGVAYLNLALACWVAVWLGLGIVCFVEVRALSSLSDTMDHAGRSLQEAGQTLGAVASIPLVGAGMRPAAERVQSLATQTVREAADSRTHIRRLSILAAVIAGAIPILLGAVAYVFIRRRLLRPAGA